MVAPEAKADPSKLMAVLPVVLLARLDRAPTGLRLRFDRIALPTVAPDVIWLAVAIEADSAAAILLNGLDRIFDRDFTAVLDFFNNAVSVTLDNPKAQKT
jgi:hypothetical protein